MLVAQSASVSANNDWNLNRPGGRLALVGRFLCLPVTILFTATNTIAARPAWLGLSWLAVAFIVRRRQNLHLFAWSAAGAIGLVLLVDLVRNSQQLDYPRYLLPATPAACALFAGVATPPSRARYSILAVLAVALALWVPRVYRPSRPAWRAFVSRIDELAPASRPLVLWKAREPAGTAVMALATYGRFDRSLFVLPIQPNQADVEPLQRAGEFFVLSSEENDPRRLLPTGKWNFLLRWRGFPSLWQGRP
jgi:hypothetical protein